MIINKYLAVKKFMYSFANNRRFPIFSDKKKGYEA